MKSTPQFTVIYEDDHIIAVNKASGVSIGGDRWDESRERLDRLVAETVYAKDSLSKIFTVHRIDRETSGLVVFAKDELTHRRLSKAFEGREVKKRYIAIVYGRPHWQEESCDLPLVPNGNKQHMTIIDKYRGKPSLTGFELLGSAGNYSILEALPETGRTHQIRVHAAALGFSIVCDPLYGTDKPVLLSAIKKKWRGDPFEEKPLLARLGLHAMELSLPIAELSLPIVELSLPIVELSLSVDMVSGDCLILNAPFPRDMAALIKQMNTVCPGIVGFFDK